MSYVHPTVLNGAIAGAGSHLNGLESTDVYDMSPDQFDRFICKVILGAMPHERLDLPTSDAGFKLAKERAIEVFQMYSTTDLAQWTKEMFESLMKAIVVGYIDAGLQF